MRGFVLALIVLEFCLCRYDAAVCNFQLGGLAYNLSPVVSEEATPFEAYVPGVASASRLFYASICTPIANIQLAKSCSNLVGKESAVVVSVNLQDCVGWGSLTTELPWTHINSNPMVGIETTYSYAGDMECPSGRHARYVLYCNGGGPLVMIHNVTMEDQCKIRFEFASSLACGGAAPIHDGGAGGGFSPGGGSAQESSGSDGTKYFLLFVVGLSLYCFIGLGFNMTQHGLTGMEAVPHIDLWYMLAVKVSKGVLCIAEFIKERFSSFMGASSYESFPANPSSGGGSNQAGSFAPPVKQAQKSQADQSYDVI